MAPHLPVELLDGIFHHLYKNANTSTVLSSMLVCKKWHAVGQSLLFDHIYLNETKAALISPVPSADLFERTCSLTLTVNLSNVDRSESHILHWLPRQLPTMRRLISLSISSTDSCSRYATNITVTNFMRLLSAIPDSVQCLEFNELGNLYAQLPTEGHPKPHHVCSILASLMPQLRTLRIKDSLICPCMFTQITKPCMKLEEVVINNRGSLIYFSCVPLRRIHGENIKAVKNLLREIWNAGMSGMMPSIKTFIFCGRRFDPVTENPALVSLDSDEFESLYKIDVLRSKTVVMPFCHKFQPIASLSGGLDTWRSWARCPDPRTGDFEFIDVCGPPNEVYAYVEGQRWVESTRGVRLSQLHKRDVNYMWKKPAVRKLYIDEGYGQNKVAELVNYERAIERDQMKPVFFDTMKPSGFLVSSTVIKMFQETQ